MAGRRARRTLLGLALATAVAVTPLASAGAEERHITHFDGFTWFDDGAAHKTGPTGGVISVYATGALANKPYQLVSVGPPTDPFRAVDCAVSPQSVNPNVRMSSSTGLIGRTGGALNRPPGTWYLCFLDPTVYPWPGYPGGIRASTVPVAYTVI